MVATETGVGGLVIIAATGGIAAGGFLGPLNFPLADFGYATGFAIVGVIGRAVLDAKAARDKAAVAGTQLPVLDYVSLAYACFGAPFVGGLALAAVRGSGFLPDWSAAPIIMGLGYMGQDGVNIVIGIFRDFVGRKTGGK